MKPEQLAPLLHFSSPGQKPEPHLRRKAVIHMGRSKVSVVHLGTLQVSLHYSGLWGTATSQLASCTLTVALEWSLPMSKHADVYRPQVNAAKEARRQMKSVFIIMCLLFVGVFIFGGVDGMRHDFTYSQYLLRFLIIAFGTKAFDIIALDYLLLTKTNFFPHVFPETKDCAGWQQFGYNRKQHLGQSVFMLICCLVLAFVFSKM